jgi:hypothetical protein
MANLKNKNVPVVFTPVVYTRFACHAGLERSVAAAPVDHNRPRNLTEPLFMMDIFPLLEMHS